MKTKNQTEQNLLELAANSAANEDGIAPTIALEPSSAPRMQGWSPYEVWRTRVKITAPRTPSGNAQVKVDLRPKLRRACRTHTKNSQRQGDLSKVRTHGAHEVLVRQHG